MSNFLRPEVRAALWRFRDVIGAAVVIAFGLWWSATFFSPVRWVGWAFVALGAIWAMGAFQRVRFNQDGDGPGVVKIVERRLAYFGPLTGGVVEMDDAVKLELEPKALPAAHWIVTSAAGNVVEIPVNADGAEALFDLFASLPGIQTQKMLSALNEAPDQRVVIWLATKPLLH